MESYLLAAVIISGVALLMSAFASIGIYLAVRKLQADVAAVMPEVRSTLAQAQSTLADTARDVREVSASAKRVLDSAQVQIDYFDQAKLEVATHFKVQSERVELVLADVLSRVQDVTSVVHGSVLRPVREVSGIVSGVKAAFQTFLTGRRPTVDRATHDDELFI